MMPGMAAPGPNHPVDPRAQGPDGRPKRNCDFLLSLVEVHKLFHVQTFPYADARGVVSAISEGKDTVVPAANHDTLRELASYLHQRNRSDVQLIPIHSTENISSTAKYVLVYIKDQPNRPNAIVVFMATHARTTAPYCQQASALVESTKKFIKTGVLRGEFLPSFVGRRGRSDAVAATQCDHPVLAVHCPERYVTPPKPRMCAGSVDAFNREYVDPPTCQGRVNPWTVYSGLPNALTCDVDLEKLIREQSMVLGRGGFGITVQTAGAQVSKVNMFPEMTDWSVPYIDDQFYRYAHVASQVEEILIGVSMKHPNILRTFGGYWCDIQRYPLGGRAVIVMEKAMFSLQEFMCRMNGGAQAETRHTAIIPIVEFDTLKGLDYLHSRNLQHRDITYRNVLVCHQPNRTPVPFAFKISDFGTASNYSTPDQQRGNRVHMAPELLWCMNSTTASDVFSWYCVMWELYTGSPLIEYKAHPNSAEYCKKTYADRLSRLVGVYTPSNPSTAFANNYMKTYDGEAVYRRYANIRPTAEQIFATLSSMGGVNQDENFTAIGVMCITLFPQERATPGQLLTLNRYQALSHDLSPVTTPAYEIPSSMRVGRYMATDAISSDDCANRQLCTLSKDGSLKTFGYESKRYYGIDVLRVSPELQPAKWYAAKEAMIRQCFEQDYALGAKRRADNPLEALLNSVYPSSSVATAGLSAKRTQLEPVPRTGIAALANPPRRQLQPPYEIPSQQGGSAPAPHQPLQGTNCDPVQYVVRTKQTKGEGDVTMVIIAKPTPDTILIFNREVVEKAISMTRDHPLLFAGPRTGVYNHSKAHEQYVFQYGQFFRSSKAMNWTPHEGESFYSCLTQVLLTLQHASTQGVLPAYITAHHLFTGRGAVMIDIVGYLSACFNQDRGELFSDHSSTIAGACAELLRQHAPDSPLIAELDNRALRRFGAAEIEQLLGDVRRLDATGPATRIAPSLLILSRVHFTIKEYLADIPNWIESKAGESDVNKCTAKLLVYGTPTRISASRFDKKECLPCPAGSDNNCSYGDLVKELVRNIILRLKVAVLKDSAVAVTSLDCTRGITKISLKANALLTIPRLEDLKGHNFDAVDKHIVYAHDERDILDWTPVVKISKSVTTSPLAHFNARYYKVLVLLVCIDRRLTAKGSVNTVDDLFRSVPLYCNTEF